MPKFRFTEIAINSTEKKKPVEEDKFTYIGLEHLDSGTLTVSRWGSDIAPIGEKLVMKKGDVLFGKRRAYQKKVGIAPFDGIFSAHGMVLRPREEVITKEYFPLFISSDYFLNEAIRISVGSLSPTVNWKDLKDLEFTIPSIEEQKRITPLIWAAIEAKNAYKEQIKCTDDLVKSQFIEMVGKATSSDKLLNHVDVLYGFPFNSKLFNNNGEGLPLLRIRDINTGLSDTFTTEQADEKYIVSDGDCLVGMDGNFEIVKWNHGSAYLNQRMCKFTPIDIQREYMMYFLRLKLKEIESVANSTTVKHLSAKDINGIEIPIVDDAAQLWFEEFSIQSDKSKFELQQAIEKVDNLIKSLIQQDNN